jgi:hypothetical protein
VAYTAPTVADFKAYFDRDFPFGVTNAEVKDSDITRALTEAGLCINEALWSEQAEYTTGYFYLTAHYLVMNLRASSQGIAGNYAWLQNSRSAGSVSESVSIPEQILRSPTLSMLAKTNYGARYLEMILPKLIGAVHAVCGATTP